MFHLVVMSEFTLHMKSLEAVRQASLSKRLIAARMATMAVMQHETTMPSSNASCAEVMSNTSSAPLSVTIGIAEGNEFIKTSL